MLAGRRDATPEARHNRPNVRGLTEAVLQTVRRKKHQVVDKVLHFNEYEFTEHFMMMGFKMSDGTRLFQEAVDGRFPPYTPSFARGEQTVCKLAPREIIKVNEIERNAAKERFGVVPDNDDVLGDMVQGTLHVDAEDFEAGGLLDSDSDDAVSIDPYLLADSADVEGEGEVFEQELEEEEAIGDAEGIDGEEFEEEEEEEELQRTDEELGLMMLARARSQVPASPALSRKLPPSFGQAPSPAPASPAGAAAAIAAEKAPNRRIPAKGPSSAGGGGSNAGTPGKRAAEPPPTYEELMATTATFSSSIEDPCEYWKCQRTYKSLATVLVADCKEALILILIY